MTSSVYAAVLRKDLPSAVAPESDEATDEGEKPEEKTEEKPDAAGADKKPDKKEAKKPPEPVRIDFEGLDQQSWSCPSTGPIT